MAKKVNYVLALIRKPQAAEATMAEIVLHYILKNYSNPINTAIQKTKEVVRDTMITGAVKAKYAKSNLLNSLNVQVKTVEGTFNYQELLIPICN